MPLDMTFEVGSLVTRKVALCALVRLLLGVNEGVSLQTNIVTKCFVALWAVVFDPFVGLFVIEKATLICICLWTQVARYLYRLLPTVNEGMFLHVTFINERFVALWAAVLDALVNPLVT